MPKIRILVIGNRFAPHFLGIVADQPDAVELIVSRDNPGQAKLAKEALCSFAHLRISDDPVFVNAYDLRQGREACRQVAARHPEAELTFDVTSAPKIPSFAALDVARELNQRLIFVDSANGKIHNDLVGGDFTTRLFVTNALPSAPNRDQKYGNYASFLQQAEARKIVVVAGDRLKDIGAIIKQETIKPTYKRI